MKRTPSTAYTEVLGKIEGHTARMAGDLEVIRLRSEIELIDAAWEKKQSDLAAAEHTGPPADAATAGSDSPAGLGCAALFIGLTCLGLGLTAAPDGRGLWGLLGIPFLVLGWWLLISEGKSENAAKAASEAKRAARQEARRDAEQAYQTRRNKVLSRMDEVRSAPGDAILGGVPAGS